MIRVRPMSFVASARGSECGRRNGTEKGACAPFLFCAIRTRERHDCFLNCGRSQLLMTIMQFAELRLPVSARMLIGIQGKDYKTHQCEANLLGYRPGESVLVTVAKKPAQVLLLEGAKVDVR